MADIPTVERLHNQHNTQDTPTPQPASPPRKNNIIKIVVNNQKKPKENHAHSHKPSDSRKADLIRLTENLAEAAKNGTLHGLGLIADFDNGYTFELEGTYLSDPGSAALPLLMLKDHVLSQVKAQEQEEDEE